MILADAAATSAAGAQLAALVRGGDAIALVGELGAGKTTFTAGLVTALGGGDAHSPTFSLVHEYPGRLIIWHADLYRLEREIELIELGLEDAIGDRRGIVIVEWADKFPSVMPADHLRIELAHSERGRQLLATGTGIRGRELAAQLDTAVTP